MPGAEDPVEDVMDVDRLLGVGIEGGIVGVLGQSFEQDSGKGG